MANPRHSGSSAQLSEEGVVAPAGVVVSFPFGVVGLGVDEMVVVVTDAVEEAVVEVPV